jgi:hypothetical protein
LDEKMGIGSTQLRREQSTQALVSFGRLSGRVGAVAPISAHSNAVAREPHRESAPSPRLTVSNWKPAAWSPWARVVPKGATFYDEVERIYRGHRARGILAAFSSIKTDNPTHFPRAMFAGD